MRGLLRWANRHAGNLLLAGLVGVAVYNWRQWQRDKALLTRQKEPEPLPPLEAWPELPLVSVLVAAWNEAGTIERHIESFLSLRYPHKELLLCAGGEDGTYDLARRHADEQVAVLRQQAGEGKQRALHRCFERASGATIFLTDADCLLDDNSFERTLWPVAVQEEQVCTGGCRPHPEQLSEPLVVAQAASDLRMYSDVHAPEYLPGLLGRNCALDRALLEETKGLEVHAPTGTDYVLAKTLVRHGASIRQMRSSQIITDYPTTFKAYLHQQRRWLRNVGLYGIQYGTRTDLLVSLRQSFIGLITLLLPVVGLFVGPTWFVPWLLVVAHGFVSRTRYLHFMREKQDIEIQPTHYAYLFISLLLDFIAWTLPLFDYLSPKRRTSW